jgi:hypothetical protein
MSINFVAMKRNRSKLLFLLFLFACEEIIPPALPKLSEILVSGIGTFSARISASIIDPGNQIIQDHGFVISEDSIPKLEENSIRMGNIGREMPVPIDFATQLNDLKSNTTYYVSPFVIINSSPVFGKTVSFKTSNIIQPGIQTIGAERITHNTALLLGTITSSGTHPVSEYGLIWSINPNPTTTENTKTSSRDNVTNFPFSFEASVQNLQANTIYNFRAYVISNGVTSYGENLTFRTGTIVQPIVVTGNATDITTNTAKLGGSLTSAGTYPVSERGVVWATTANPTVNDFKASVSGNITNFPDNYTVNAVNLALGTTYNYRAYVISNGVVAYGENKIFKTTDMFQPTVSTGEAKASDRMATLFGTVSAKGSHPISQYGVCWSTSPNPTTTGSKIAISGDIQHVPAIFSIAAENLSPNTTYHYRAYVIMNGVTTYGADNTFITGVNQPSVTSVSATNVTAIAARLNGRVNSQGSFPITEIGVCWGTSSNPTTSGNKLSKNGSGVSLPHSYDFSPSGLTPGTNYFFRAYVVSNGQTYYGSNISFQTQPVVNPTLETLDQIETISGGRRVFGRIASGGTYRITEYGFLYWTPDIAAANRNYLTAKKLSNQVANNTFLLLPASFNKIVPITLQGTYVYATYAITSDGKIHYGPARSFNFIQIN